MEEHRVGKRADRKEGEREVRNEIKRARENVTF